VNLSQVQRIRFLKPSLEQDFRKALEVLANRARQAQEDVSLNFAGGGRRAVKVGYITERIRFGNQLPIEHRPGQALLASWAIVENTTDEDWNNVNLRLGFGPAISFQMDLYQPLFVPRPVEVPELFASLRPQTYGGDLAAKDAEKPAEQKRAMMGGVAAGGCALPTVPATSGARYRKSTCLPPVDQNQGAGSPCSLAPS